MERNYILCKNTTDVQKILKHRDSFGKEKKKKKNLFYIW